MCLNLRELTDKVLYHLERKSPKGKRIAIFGLQGPLAIEIQRECSFLSNMIQPFLGGNLSNFYDFEFGEVDIVIALSVEPITGEILLNNNLRKSLCHNQVPTIVVNLSLTHYDALPNECWINDLPRKSDKLSSVVKLWENQVGFGYKTYFDPLTERVFDRACIYNQNYDAFSLIEQLKKRISVSWDKNKINSLETTNLCRWNFPRGPLSFDFKLAQFTLVISAEHLLDNEFLKSFELAIADLHKIQYDEDLT